MNDVTGAIGTIAEGALWSRAVEPTHSPSRADDGHTHEHACLNCGTELIGPHCHGCGQHAHIHRTLGAFFHDLLHGALHLEGKTWSTLPMLVRRPGQLTRRYIDGERATFVSPMGLFLFTIFIMFAVFQIAGVSPPAELGLPPQVEAGLDEALSDARQERAELTPELAATPAGDPSRAVLERRATELDETINGLEMARPRLHENVPFTELRTGWARLDHGIDKANKNPGLMLYKLQSNSYKFSWLLIPLSMPFMALLFAWRRRFGMYDHAVFVTYSLSFMSLLFVVLTLLAFAGAPLGWLAAAGMLIPLWHIATQMRHAYGLSRASAIWRTAALAIFIQIIVVLFVALLLMLGLMG